MVVVAIGGIWAGGVLFNVLIALICGLMVWELARMLAPQVPRLGLQMGLMSGAMILLSGFVPPLLALPFLLAPAIAGAVQITRHRGSYLAFAALIGLAGFSLILVRTNLGIDWFMWMILVVIVTDLAGYFAGKSIGGAKLWPRVSPNKTWSGTVAGWVGAVAVGLVFASITGAGNGLIAVSVVLSMVSQAGDIAESALKRRAGVKDSSALIPGHGGVMDRFDGMLWAAVFVLFSAVLFGFPAGLV